jgi:hypothetical protein
LSRKENHLEPARLFQDHLALETIREFRIILGLEYAAALLCRDSNASAAQADKDAQAILAVERGA